MHTKDIPPSHHRFVIPRVLSIHKKALNLTLQLSQSINTSPPMNLHNPKKVVPLSKLTFSHAPLLR